MAQKTIGNLALAECDDILKICSVIEQNTDGEHIRQIQLSELYEPEFHPFQVVDDEDMLLLSESVKKNGVREPGLARPRAEGGYELLSGNRRKRASELVGKLTMPIIVRELDDDEAALVMVDSNLERRENILPSELAWSYKVMMDALNHKGVKDGQPSCDIVAERTGVQKSQLFRYIRLTELIAELIDKVDTKQLAFNPAVELSYLSIKEQTAVAKAMELFEVKPSLSQAVRLKKLKLAGELTPKQIDVILSEIKRPTNSENPGTERFRKYFPPGYSQKQMDTVIVKLLKGWKAKETA